MLRFLYLHYVHLMMYLCCLECYKVSLMVDIDDIFVLWPDCKLLMLVVLVPLCASCVVLKDCKALIRSLLMISYKLVSMLLSLVCSPDIFDVVKALSGNITFPVGEFINRYQHFFWKRYRCFFLRIWLDLVLVFVNRQCRLLLQILINYILHFI